MNTSGALPMRNGNNKASVVSKTKNALTPVSRGERFCLEPAIAETERGRHVVLDSFVANGEAGNRSLELRIIEFSDPPLGLVFVLKVDGQRLAAFETNLQHDRPQSRGEQLLRRLERPLLAL